MTTLEPYLPWHEHISEEDTLNISASEDIKGAERQDFGGSPESEIDINGCNQRTGCGWQSA